MHNDLADHIQDLFVAAVRGHRRMRGIPRSEIECLTADVRNKVADILKDKFCEDDEDDEA